ncbi:hypothetical protein NSK_005547 [Nannochloropsis salina CCMP1776]|uniref:DNA-directed RNA polymerase III subunit RPC9 n=1 Tax=Nannochloropsis salina CCMP1776 TaxID=1027361 RepID=A0A4D9CY44_9STRA|nr:hypothetical protein NSK_005547 [Nannochloropsis salina CCMP1776]|eukprot:TFJ83127.1 hypothetical protein NSK_005547 [Nannochloropsis salina CCMP1776]
MAQILRCLGELPAGGESKGGVQSFLKALQAFSVTSPPSLPPSLSPSLPPSGTAAPAFTRQSARTFTLAETLQLINMRPTAPVEVHLVGRTGGKEGGREGGRERERVIEECAERLTDEDVEALCDLVTRHLGGGPAGEGRGGGGE